MATVGYATLDVIPSVRGLRANLERQMAGGLAAAGRTGGAQFGNVAGATAASGFQSKFRSGIDSIGGRLFAGLGLAAAGKAVVGLQADFEASINTLGVAADLTGAEMQKMADFAKQMGADTVFSASEAADAMVELAKAGMTPATIQAGALSSTMAVAATEGLALADSATIVSNAMTTFGIEGERAAEVADALAGGSKASTASVASLSEALRQVGGSALDAGLTLQETVAALAAFDQEGIKGSDAGTSLKTMLSRLVPQTDKAANAMEGLGLKFTDASGQFLPLADIAEQLQGAMQGLSDAERTTALNTIFGSDARRAAIALIHQGRKGIEDFTDATTDAGTAAELADARMSGTAGAIEQMKGSLEGAGLAAGEVLAPAVTIAADTVGLLADAVSGLPKPLQTAALAFGALKVASAFGVSPAAGVGKLSSGLDTLRLRAMLAGDEYRRLRTASIVAEKAGFRFNDTASRTSAALGAIRTGAAGAGSALRRGLGGAIGILGGPWGLALIGGVAALTKFQQGQQEAKQRVEELTASLDQQTGSITKQSKELAFKALQDSGAIDSARRLGIELDDVARASLGNEAALAQVNAQLDEFVAQTTGANAELLRDEGFRKLNEDATDLREALGLQNEELSEARQTIQDQAEFMGKAETATDNLRIATDEYRDKIVDTRKEIDRLLDSEEKRRLAAVQSKQDELALIETLKAAEKEARKGKETLDESTKAGRENWNALLDLADQWNNSTDKVRNARGAYADMRKQFINLADQMNGPGGTREAAVKLADKLLTLPKDVPIRFRSEGYKERMEELRILREAMNAISNGFSATVDFTPRGFGSTGNTTTTGGGGGGGGGSSKTNTTTVSPKVGATVNVGVVNVTGLKNVESEMLQKGQQAALGGFG